MTVTSEIILYVLWAFLFLIVGTNGIFNLVKFFRKSKLDESEYKVRCNLLADLIEKGVEVPKDLIVAILRGQMSQSTFASRIAALSQEKPLKKGK